MRVGSCSGLQPLFIFVRFRFCAGQLLRVSGRFVQFCMAHSRVRFFSGWRSASATRVHGHLLCRRNSAGRAVGSYTWPGLRANGFDSSSSARDGDGFPLLLCETFSCGGDYHYRCRSEHDNSSLASNQSMKPTAPRQNNFNLIATTPCRGLSLSR